MNKKLFKRLGAISLCSVMLVNGLIIEDRAFAQEEEIGFREYCIQQGELEESNVVQLTEKEVRKQDKNAKKYNKLCEKIQDKKGKEVEYPEYYAGAYLDEEKNLVVNLAVNSKKNKEKVKDVVGDVEFQASQYSYNELMDAYTELSAYDFESRKNAPQVIWISVDEINNCVNVGIQDLKNTDAEWIQKNVCKTDCIKYTNAEAETEDCDTYVRPGQYLDNGAVSFSAGFMADRINSSGEYVFGFITCAHGGNTVGTDIYNWADTRLGHVTLRQNSGNCDASFVRLKSTACFDPDVLYADSSGSKGRGETLCGMIYNMPVGYTVYKNGATSYRTQGTITSTNFTANDITDMYAANAYAAGGDSGGTFYATLNSSYYYAGIVKGRINAVDNPDYWLGTTYFVKATNILNAFGCVL